MYCSPLSIKRKNGKTKIGKSTKTCFDRSSIVSMAKAYNKHIGKNVIQIRKPVHEIWKHLYDELYNVCRDKEWCWIKQGFIQKHPELYNMLDQYFMPEGPAKTRDWLSTININQVMSRYEKIYPHFKFFGPVPIDFKKVFPELHNLNLKQLLNHGITKVGIVFNLDPSYMSGSHWVSMFINIDKGIINYFDSYGKCPAPKEIVDLILTYSQQLKNEGYDPKVNCNSQRHQYDNYDCGVYGISFLLLSLKGLSFRQINNQQLTDEAMVMLRNKYFRPKV